MRKRRTKRYTWLPIIPDVYTNGSAENYDLAYRQFILTIGPALTPAINVFPVVNDFNDQSGKNATARMGDVIGNEYFLKRIVGKLFLTYSQDSEAYASGTRPPVWPASIITAGFFVARDESDISPSLLPIGLSTGTAVAVFDDYSPAAEATAREPWIWRRSWVLANNFDEKNISTQVINNGWSFFPANNAEYGSVLDGPHIDARTARRIKTEERLWFAIAATPIATTAGDLPIGSTYIHGLLDARYLGALRKARNTGSF